MPASGAGHSRSPGGAAVGFTVHLVCPHCAKEFTGNSSTSGVRSNYRRHLLTHTGERPFPCTYCHQRFTTKPNLRRHVRSLHPFQATPSAQRRHPNGMEAEDVGPVASPPLPEMHLPPTTTATAAELTSTGSAAVAADASPGLSCSPLPPQSAGTVTFTCSDCELEMSSRARLRRHQRYFCPFRDNVFADPVKDAVDLYRAQQQREHRQRYSRASSSSSGGSDDRESAEKGNGDDDDTRVSSVDERARRPDRTTPVPLTLTEAERSYLVDVAERSGLKFVEDAYASDDSGDDGPDSDMFTDTSFSSTSSRSPYRTAMKRPAPPHPRSPAGPGGALSPPKRTPPHGPLSSLSFSPNWSVMRSPQTAAAAAASSIASSSTSTLTPCAVRDHCLLSVGNGLRRSEWFTAEDANENENEDTMGLWTVEDLLHLHHHRRGSGRRRERHILQKRLRAQEGALMALATDSPHRQPRKVRAADIDAAKHGSDTVVGKAKPRRLQVAPPADTAHSSGAAATAAYAYLGPSQSLLTPHVVAQAEGLVVVDWCHPRRGRNGAANAFVCPYCDDYTTFTSQRGLRAHATRAHAEIVARARMRVAKTEAARVEDCNGGELGEGDAPPLVTTAVPMARE
ncbi:hypothetical protein GH5_05205 [Leishmania sp. Ghana 2012 LV757]|uniref:hypothetical protein n=1 Tax=Leishmania sp. Ghana 2012 LV757 TaxID=2803181 RepID=UPI001B44FF8C|nr:hypothetical protein GH5_05205 [Leishmania sp. Ghana 2012 LV757]